MRNLQIERQAVSPRAILDFTLPRIPAIPEVVLKRFPDVKQTVDELDRFRIAMQLQLREQFVALREQVIPIKTIETLESFRETTTYQLQNITNQLQTVVNVINQTAPTSKATDTTAGVVKVDKDVTDPVVYLTTTIDDLVNQLKAVDALIQAQLDVVVILVASILANAAPLIHISGDGVTPNFPLITPPPSNLASIWCVNDTDNGRWLWNGTSWI